MFTRTKIAARRIASDLDRHGFAATAIHSDRTQAERIRALADFKAGVVEILVATDVASRGLDIEELPVVVNFDLPMKAEDYVHRIGRTGRAGASGIAISLACPDEVDYLRLIQRLLRWAIPVEVVEELLRIRSWRGLRAPRRRPDPGPPAQGEPGPPQPLMADAAETALPQHAGRPPPPSQRAVPWRWIAGPSRRPPATSEGAPRARRNRAASASSPGAATYPASTP